MGDQSRYLSTSLFTDKMKCTVQFINGCWVSKDHIKDIIEEIKEHIMKHTLEMAHDENEKLRESAVKLLNEMAADMG